MKIGDLIIDDDGDYGVIVEVVEEDDDVGPDLVVYYATLRSAMGAMGEEEKYHWMYKDQIEVICEGR